jgi:hypothetical protein
VGRDAPPGDAAARQRRDALSEKLQAKQAHDRLAAGADDKAPAGYQKQVDDYFKAIAGEETEGQWTTGYD